ncbi:MAG: hypothetical protein NTX95_04330 [Actinobacteria bacterium]|nr:hypothetical protein [Actinomycetota bacterium]
MRRLPVPIFLLVAVALTASACSFVSPTAYLSVNRAAAPLADDKSVTATAASGAVTPSTAAAAGIETTTTTIDLTASSKTTIDLTGSWLVWTPLRFNQTAGGGWSPAALKPEWACPSGTWAWFESADVLLAPLSDLIALTGGGVDTIAKQLPAQAKPFTYGLQCAKAFEGNKLTLDTPALPTSASRVTWLFVSTTTSALQPWSFHLQDGTTFESPAAVGMPIQATSWMRVNLKKAEPVTPVATAPTARLIARATPASASGAIGEYLWREVDARTSTDPGGTALTYSWDLNGDGVYGDQPAAQDASVTVPSGVAIVPDSVLQPFVIVSEGFNALTQGPTVGVKVTNAAGQTGTATTMLTPASFTSTATSEVDLSTEAPSAGATVTATFTKTASSLYVDTACVDYDGDGAYESTVTFSDQTTTESKTATFTALAAGPHVVTTAFADNVANCTASPASVFRAVYISSASGTRRLTGSSDRASGYSAVTTMRLSKGKTLRVSSKAPQTMRLDGSVFGGRYRWSTPRRGNGAMRPGAFGAFAGGAYVAQAGKMTVVGGAASEVGMGSGTILLRGASSVDLLCATAVSPGPVQKTVILGGTGAGARLQGTLTGNGFMMPYDAIGFVGMTGTGKHLQPEFGQVKPFSNTATLTASNGTARKLPKACRALVKYLPARNGGDSSTPSVVTG